MNRYPAPTQSTQHIARRGHRRLGALLETAGDLRYALSPRTWTERWPKFDTACGVDALKFFDDHGWVIFQHVFEPAEIQAWRERAERSHQLHHTGDLLSDPNLGDHTVVLDQRIINIATRILRGTPCYFGDSSASMDVRISGFHKDNPDRGDTRGPDWTPEYPIIRMGIYLQDHVWHSGGLAVRDRSHLPDSARRSRPLALPSAIGDMIVWSMRTTHSGYATRCRMAPNAFVPLPVVKLFGLTHLAGKPLASGIFRPIEHNRRLALFITFGLRGPHLDRYLAYLQTRQYAVKLWKASVYDAPIAEAAKMAGIELIPMSQRVRDLDASTLHKQHVPIHADNVPM